MKSLIYLILLLTPSYIVCEQDVAANTVPEKQTQNSITNKLISTLTAAHLNAHNQVLEDLQDDRAKVFLAIIIVGVLIYITGKPIDELLNLYRSALVLGIIITSPYLIYFTKSILFSEDNQI